MARRLSSAHSQTAPVEQVADVVPLALARPLQQLQQPERPKVEEQQLQQQEFDAILAPLEARAGRRLNGRGRAACWRAYLEALDGFLGCAADALERGTKPLGLLVRMVEDGDHLLDVPASEDELLRRRMAEVDGQ